MKNPKLNKKQKDTVNKYCQELEGKLKRIIDRTCRYKDAVIEYQKAYPRTNGKTTYLTIEKKLELTPTGKVRATYHKETYRFTLNSSFYDEEQSLLNLEIECDVIELPKDTKIKHLYRTRSDKQKEKVKPQKPEQLSLTLDGKALITQENIIKNDGIHIYAEEEILRKMETVYCHQLKENIKIPTVIIALMNEYKLTFREQDEILFMSELVSPQFLIQMIFDIEDLRDNPHYKNFNHPITVTEPIKKKQSIIQQVKL